MKVVTRIPPVLCAWEDEHILPRQAYRNGYHVYLVDVETGNLRGAGTDALITIELFGQRDGAERRSGKIVLCTSDKLNKFERGQIDHFRVCAHTHLGEIRSCTISQDDTGFASEWYLEQIVVTHVGTTQGQMQRKDDSPKWQFTCQAWFNKQHGLSRQLEIGTAQPETSLLRQSSMRSPDRKKPSMQLAPVEEEGENTDTAALRYKKPALPE
jgi:hypothetical protein